LEKYFKRIFILILLLSNLTGCITSENVGEKKANKQISKDSEITNLNTPTKLILQTVPEDDELVVEWVKKFMSSKSVAFDTNNFSIIRDFFEPESDIYDAFQLGVTYFYQSGIRERLVKYSIQDVKYDANKDIFKVNVYERVDIKYPNANYCLNDYYWTVLVKKHNENIYISDLVGWDIDEQLKFPLKRVKKIEPKYYKNEKSSMTKVAIEGVKKYMEVEYKVVNYSKTVNACNFAYGAPLIELFKNYKERSKIISDKKITRKIEMIEMSYTEFAIDKGLVDLNLKLDIWEDQKHRKEEIKCRVKLIKMDEGVWFINQIENLPLV
jgi:hypothetical protein